MDWQLAIDKHREALSCVLAMLISMAGLRRPVLHFDEGEMPIPTLPRHLHRAVLRLLRPAEWATRRLIIIMARGLVVRAVRNRMCPTSSALFLRGPGGTGVRLVAAGAPSRPAPLAISLPLFDPPRRLHVLRRAAAGSVPRISLPGVTVPFVIAPRRAPAFDDALDAKNLVLRLRGLHAALEDLPRQAMRFARRQAAIIQQEKPRRWPIRNGPPPGTRRRQTHDVFSTLTDLHGLAFDALARPDTS
ncbi:hypothetical protein GA830_13000 [Mesorhizobium sp. NBSH29]|uniref:hypothetical protein n=1 Tax=Mesorhizobium sp. NBSH29 TaxID=2654249 RepID=UPI0018968FCC|nr:hypothetical protein [Mesorhizobium sp. NBSH29]QPC87564.1 hypothetical protein GA830_13000 [Mesorhizobium sp. NBSH29]